MVNGEIFTCKTALNQRGSWIFFPICFWINTPPSPVGGSAVLAPWGGPINKLPFSPSGLREMEPWILSSNWVSGPPQWVTDCPAFSQSLPSSGRWWAYTEANPLTPESGTLPENRGWKQPHSPVVPGNLQATQAVRQEAWVLCPWTRRISQPASRKLSGLTSRGGMRQSRRESRRGGQKNVPHPDGQPRIWDYVTLPGKSDSADKIQKKTPIWLDDPRLSGREGVQLNHTGP